MKRPLIQQRTGQTNAATAVVIAFPPVPPGELWEIREWRVHNNSGEAVTIPTGIVGLGGFQPLDYPGNYVNSGGGATLINTLIREGESFAIEVTGAALQGEIVLRISGWIYTPDPEEILVVAPATP